MSRFEGIDPREALVDLGVADVTDVRPISGGFDTLIWRVDTPGGSYALRLFRADQGEQCSREVLAMQVARTMGVPVPGVISRGMWRDRPVMLMEWCGGRTVLDEVRADPERLGAVGASMGRLQARIHALSVPRELWEDHRTWLGLAGPDETNLVERLRVGGLHDGHLLHLDLHPLNVLCRGGEAIVVLDWANTAVGDWRADVARTLSIFRLAAPPDAAAGGFGLLRAELECAWMDGYAQVAGPLPEMALFEIWAEAAFIRDMEKKIGMPDFWMQPADFDRLRAHLADLKRTAGVR